MEVETQNAGKTALDRLSDARRARQLAQKGCRLATELALRLERQLRDAAEAGMRVELARRLELKRRLLAVNKVAADTRLGLRAPKQQSRRPALRYGMAAALCLLLASATAALGPFSPDALALREAAAPAPVLQAAAGDGLRLSLAYSIRLPAER